MLAHEQFPLQQLVEFGVAAEQAGFLTMAALGGRTKKVWIGPTVTCPSFRYNPTVVAEAFASLSLLYSGRIFLGIGSGEALNEQAAVETWPKWQERSDRLLESADIIRKLWTGQSVSHKGTYYSVDAKLYDPPAKSIPLLMAANGPKAMRRAGQYGDGLVTDPKTWKEHKSEFEAGARAAGKDPSQLPVLVEQYAVVGDQSEAKKAAELWRFGPKAFKAYYNVRDPREIEKRADREIPLDQVYSEWPVGTDPNVHLKTINDLFASGATIVNIHTGQADQKRVIDFYGKQVLPKVQH